MPETALYRLRRATHLCVACGVLLPDGHAIVRCAVCAVRDRAIKKARRLYRQAAGTCVGCGDSAVLAAMVGNQNALCEACYYRKTANRRLGSPRYAPLLREKFLAQDGRCPYSGESLTLGLNATLDHILPTSRYPELRGDPANVEWVIDWVNLMKQDATPDEFRERLHHILSHRWP